MPDSRKIYAVTVNEFNFHIDESTLASADMVNIRGSMVNVIRDQHSVNASVRETDNTGKKLAVEIDGETFHVDIKDELDQMLEKMGFNATAGKQMKEIKHPCRALFCRSLCRMVNR